MLPIPGRTMGDFAPNHLATPPDISSSLSYRHAPASSGLPGRIIGVRRRRKKRNTTVMPPSACETLRSHTTATSHANATLPLFHSPARGPESASTFPQAARQVHCILHFSYPQHPGASHFSTPIPPSSCQTPQPRRLDHLYRNHPTRSSPRVPVTIETKPKPICIPARPRPNSRS
jgi:hypothetical protein